MNWGWNQRCGTPLFSQDARIGFLCLVKGHISKYKSAPQIAVKGQKQTNKQAKQNRQQQQNKEIPETNAKIKQSLENINCVGGRKNAEEGMNIIKTTLHEVIKD